MLQFFLATFSSLCAVDIGIEWYQDEEFAKLNSLSLTATPFNITFFNVINANGEKKNCLWTFIITIELSTMTTDNIHQNFGQSKNKLIEI